MKYYGNELYHHGILGQKWGIRRFQNKDGSYTTEGKKRRLKDVAKQAVSPSIKQGKDKPSVSPAGQIVKSSKDMLEGVKKLRKVNEPVPEREDLTKYTDKDLQQMINRMNLENQYNRLKSEQVNIGKDKVDKFLDTAIATLEVAGSAATILSAIYLIVKK